MIKHEFSHHSILIKEEPTPLNSENNQINLKTDGNSSQTEMPPVFVKTYNEKGHFSINVLQPFHCSKPVETYNCANCGFQTQLLLSLTKHIKQVHQDSKFDCNFFQRRDCWICDFKTYSLLVLLRHLTKHHFKNFKSKKFRSFRWLECEQCPYISPLLSPLKKHIYAKHIVPENMKWFKCKMYPVELKMLESVRWYECDQCMYRSKRKFHLNQHKLLEHVASTRMKLWHCDYCPVKVKVLHKLRSHVWNDHNMLFVANPRQFRFEGTPF